MTLTIDGRILVRAGVACLIPLFGPSEASAQVTAPREPAQIAIGPASLYPTLRLAEAGLDDNIFNDAENPKEDVTATLEARLLSVVRLGLNELLFTVGSDYVWFKDYVSERTTDSSYAVRFNLSASRFKPFLGTGSTWTSDRANVEIDTRARRFERMVTGGANFGLTDRTSITGSVQRDELRFQDGERFRGVELAGTLNSTGLTYTGGIRYALTPFTTISANGVYRVETFEQSPFRDAKSYAVTPMVEFAPEAIIRGSFSAGYEAFVPEDPSLAENRGLVFEGVLNWSVAGMTQFDLTLGREVNYSYQDIQPYYLQTGVRLAVTQRLFGPLSVQGSADRQHLAYRSQQGVSPTPAFDDRVDTSDVFAGGVAFNLGRGVSVLGGLEKTRRRSSLDPRQNFDRTRLLSTITIGN